MSDDGSIRVDLTSAQDFIEAGLVRARFVDYKIESGRSSGLPYARCQWTVQEGENAGYKIFDNLSFSPNAAFRVVMFLDGIGETAHRDSQGKTVKGFDIDLRKYLGTEAVLELTVETYETDAGVRSRNSIKAIHPLDGGPSAASSDDEEGPRRRRSRRDED